MKRIFTKKITIFIAIALLFIFGQLFGNFAIGALFVRYNISVLEPQAEEIAGQMEKGERDFPRAAFIVKAFSSDGQEILENYGTEKSLGLKDKELDPSLQKLLPQILAGGRIADLRKIGSIAVKSIVVGVPFRKNGAVVGAVFLLKPADDYQTVLNSFTLVFSVTLAAGTLAISIFMTLYLRETKRLEQLRRDYIANISHELKSPISSIKALTETLYDGLAEEKEMQQRYFSIILSESSRLEKLISEMLELSRLQSGKTVFVKQKVDARNLMESVRQKYAVLADDLGISFEVTSAAACLPILYTNAERIEQVLNILLDNAIKFVGEAGKIVVDAEIGRTSVTVSVKDNGPGIEKEVLPYVFDRFYKRDRARSTQGSGLGLSIAKEIMEGLGERIYASSEFGKGSVFSITVKRA